MVVLADIYLRRIIQCLFVFGDANLCIFKHVWQENKYIQNPGRIEDAEKHKNRLK